MSDPITTGGHVPQDQGAGAAPPTYEPIETSVRTVSKWLIVLASLIVGALITCFLILAELTDARGHATTAASSPRQRLDRPAPRLKYDSPVPRLELNRIEDERLTTSAWVDRERGVARIPIEQAMDIIAKQSGTDEKAGTSQRRGADEATE